MRFTLVKRICALLLCACILLESGCFPVHSILGETEAGYSFEDGSLDVEVKLNSGTQVLSGNYPEGKRAFKFVNCTYEADISGFKLIACLGNTFVYYYMGIRVIGDEPDEHFQYDNKKGYYNKDDYELEYFWSVSSYNFETEEYKTIKQLNYAYVSDKGKINCNSVALAQTDKQADFMVNIGYDFYMFSMVSEDGLDYKYQDKSWKGWSLSDSNKKEIKKKLGISSNSFCCTDVAVKVTHSRKFAAAFMILPDDDNFTQESAMFELELISGIDNTGNEVRKIGLTSKADNIHTVKGGNILSSNYESGNCIYVLRERSDGIKFGIDNRDRKTTFSIGISEDEDEENTVLQSFSVKDYAFADGTISDEESILELVFRNRVEYYKIERYTEAMGLKVEYRAVLLKTYPISNFNMNYLSSDDMPCIVLNDDSIDLSSSDEGFKRISSDGSIVWEYTKGAAYFSVPYKKNTNKSIIVGFNDYSFDQTVINYDENGNQTRTTKTSSEFSLAQLPFATVVIK